MSHKAHSSLEGTPLQPDSMNYGKVQQQAELKHALCAGLLDSWPTPAAKAKHQAALDRLQRLQLLLPARSKEYAPRL